MKESKKKWFIALFRDNDFVDVKKGELSPKDAGSKLVEFANKHNLKPGEIKILCHTTKIGTTKKFSNHIQFMYFSIKSLPWLPGEE